MKEVKVKLYEFSELSEDAKHAVCERDRENSNGLGYDTQQIHGEERMDSLKAFCECFGIVFRIDYDHQYRFISWRFQDYSIDDENISGKYLWRFLDKYYYQIHTRKQYWAPFKYDENGKLISPTPRRKSRIFWVERNCPFTGVCYDEDILDEIWKWLKNPDWNISLHDLFENCFHYFLKSWEDEDDYDISDEGLSESIEANSEGQLYFEDGTEFNGDYGEFEDHVA